MADVKDLKVNGTKYNIKIPSANVKTMTGYSKGSSTDAITPSDSLNSAIGKLECRADKNQTNILYTLGKTGKNIFKLDLDVVKKWNTSGTWTNNVYTKSGLTITFNTDGTISITGTATGRVDVALNTYDPRSDYYNSLNGLILSGCPSGGAWNRYALKLQMTDSPYSQAAQDTGSGATINTASIPSTANMAALYLSIYSGYPTTSMIFKPMVCTPEDWAVGHDFAPYALPNYDLTRLESEDRASLAEVVDGGAKNLLKIEGETREVNGVTATYNSDGSITTSGTASGGNTNFTIHTYTPAEATKLSGLVLSGCPSGGSTNTWRLVLQKNSANYDVYAEDTGNGAVVGTVPSVSCVLILQIKSGYSKNATWYPMLCTKAAFGVSQKFVPYRPDLDTVKKSVDFTTRMDTYGVDSISNANLNNITVSEERVYNNPTNLPSGTSGYVICKTVVCDAHSAYQEIRFISSQINTTYGQSYAVFERCKVAGTWRDWNILDINGSYRLDTGSSNATSKTIDISNIPDGIFLVTTRCSISPTNRVGVSVYILWIISSNYASSMFKSISETTNAKISSFSIASDGTATITYDGSGYHTTSLTRISI